MDDEIITNKDLTWTERIVYSYIQGFVRNNKICWATSKTIAERFHFNESHVRAARSRLVKRGMLEKFEHKGSYYFTTAKSPSGILEQNDIPEKSEQNQAHEIPTLLATANVGNSNTVGQRQHPLLAGTNTDRWLPPTPLLASANTYNKDNIDLNSKSNISMTEKMRLEAEEEFASKNIDALNKAAERLGLNKGSNQF